MGQPPNYMGLRRGVAIFVCAPGATASSLQYRRMRLPRLKNRDGWGSLGRDDASLGQPPQVCVNRRFRSQAAAVAVAQSVTQMLTTTQSVRPIFPTSANSRNRKPI